MAEIQSVPFHALRGASALREHHGAVSVPMFEAALKYLPVHFFVVFNMYFANFIAGIQTPFRAFMGASGSDF